jgi:tRNA(Ile)-lysidine synthase
VLGHTADDQAETILMHLLRGAGMEGLRGMPRLRSDEQHIIIRPMLTITRDAIVSELNAENIAFVEDASNQDRRFLRNRIRHEILPLLETVNPNIKETLLRGAMVLEEENKLIEARMENVRSKIIVAQDTHAVTLDISLLMSQPLALQRRLLRWGVRKIQGDLTGIAFDTIETILNRLSKNFTLTLPHGILARKAENQLTLSVALPLAIPPEAIEISLDVSKMVIPQWGIEISIRVSDQGKPEASPSAAVFDRDQISSPVVIRRWREGDRFVPFGMKGRHKKVHDFFIDMKIPKSKRDKIPLLVCPEGIIWVMGFRTDERFQLTEQTKRFLHVDMRIV